MKNFGAIVLVVLVVLVGWFVFRQGQKDGSKLLGLKTYSSEKWGLSFSYPDNYVLQEQNLASSTNLNERIRASLVLVEDTTIVPENGESGPAITINIFQNNLDNYTAEKWVRGVSDSNFKLSDGTITAITLSGETAISYRASGLYENDNAVVARPGFVYMFTVGHLSPQDKIRQDFQVVLNSLKFK